MVRIRGRIGDWPVDLTLELDDEDWARLRGPLAPPEPGAAAAPAQPAGAAVNGGDRLWQLAQELLRRAGEVDGPQLLAELGALAGSPEAGKRLLVRLRHNPQVRVETAADAPLYRWIGAAGP